MPDAVSYLDFDLLIRRAEGGYRAQVLSSPAGEATADFTLPFSALELENFVLRVGRPRTRHPTHRLARDGSGKNPGRASLRGRLSRRCPGLLASEPG